MKVFYGECRRTTDYCKYIVVAESPLQVQEIVAKENNDSYDGEPDYYITPDEVYVQELACKDKPCYPLDETGKVL